MTEPLDLDALGAYIKHARLDLLEIPPDYRDLDLGIKRGLDAGDALLAEVRRLQEALEKAEHKAFLLEHGKYGKMDFANKFMAAEVEVRRLRAEREKPCPVCGAQGVGKQASGGVSP